MPTWTIDPAGLQRVQAHFGLTHPLYVRRTRGRQRLGAYHGTRFGFELSKKLEPYWQYHSVTVSAALDAEAAAKVVMHEACHAAQCERDPGAMVRYNRELRRSGGMGTSNASFMTYRAHPMEVEARRAEKWAEVIRPVAAAM